MVVVFCARAKAGIGTEYEETDARMVAWSFFGMNYCCGGVQIADVRPMIEGAPFDD